MSWSFDRMMAVKDDILQNMHMQHLYLYTGVV